MRLKIRDAAHVQADTAQPFFIDYGSFLSKLRGPDCSDISAGPGTDDNHTSYCSDMFSPFHNLGDFNHGLAD
jgi:hypothetical protein